MRTTLTATSLLLLTGCLTAQLTNFTAHPIDQLHGVSGHWTPFGALDTGGADESRSQHLFLAPYLPAGGAFLVGIDVAAHFTGNAPYQSLQIHAGVTTAVTLTSSFAANLPTPVTVFSSTNFSINWTSTTMWRTVMFQTPYFYDGTSNLVIETQKIIDRPNNPAVPTITQQMTNLPMRRDLPRPLFRDGTYNSGASSSPTGTIYSGPPMLMRLRWITPATLLIGSTVLPGTNYFHLTSTLRLDVQASPGSIFVDFFDAALATTPLPIPPMRGAWWLSPTQVLLGIGVCPPMGPGRLSFPIPNDPSLVGAKLYFQSLVLGSAQAWSNVVDGIIAQ